MLLRNSIATLSIHTMYQVRSHEGTLTRTSVCTCANLIAQMARTLIRAKFSVPTRPNRAHPTPDIDGRAIGIACASF
jgi:hypothetical protein